MKNKHSILETIKHLHINHDQLREWLHMNYLEEELGKLKNKITQNQQKNNEILIHMKELLLKKGSKIKKIHIKDMDVISLFKELIRKNKVSIEEADIYINEWFQYAKANCQSKKITKKYILLIMSLLLIESAAPIHSSAEMLEMKDSQMDGTTGKAGISIVMTSSDGSQAQKEIDLNHFDKQVNSFIDNIKAKVADQGENEIVIDMADMAKEFESVQILSPVGGMQLDNLKISGSGKARISLE